MVTDWNISLHPPLGFVRRRAKSHWPVCIKWHPGSRCPPLDHHTFFPERALEQHTVGSRRKCRVYCPRRTRYWSQSRLFWCWNQRLTASFLPTHIHKRYKTTNTKTGWISLASALVWFPVFFFSYTCLEYYVTFKSLWTMFFWWQ